MQSSRLLAILMRLPAEGRVSVPVLALSVLDERALRHAVAPLAAVCER